MATLQTRHRLRALLALVVAAGIALTAWRGGSAEAAEVPRLRAGDIADAVLFNDGPAAKYLTGLKLGPMPKTDELREIQREIKTKVEADPEFAGTFAARMQSGDPRQCASALSDLGGIARGVLYRRYGQENVDATAAELDKRFAAGSTGSGAIVDNQYSNSFSLDEDLNTYQDSIHIHEFYRDTSWHADVEVLTDVAVDTLSPATLMLATVVVFNLPMEYGDRTDLAGEVLLNHIAADLRSGEPR